MSNFNSAFVSKFTKRFVIILLNGFNTIAPQLTNMVISYLVISFVSSEFWGSVVYIIILLDFAFNIISWGNKPFLIQEYSLSPQSINHLWRTSFTSRIIWLLLFIVVIFFFNYSLQIKLCLVLWVIARYIYQSFDALILFNKNFVFSVLTELTGLCVLLIPVMLFRNTLTLSVIISLYTLSVLIKSGIAIIYYRKIVVGELFSKTKPKYHFKTSLNYFIVSFPFLLLTFSGMLQSKTDLYTVAYFLKKTDVAHYQIYLGFLGLSQLIASLFLSPFARNIFRLSKNSLKKLERLFITAGVFISFFLTVFIYFLLTYIYHFSFSFYMYLLGYLYVLAFYLYLLKNYEFGRQRKQGMVALFSFIGSFVNFLFGIILTPLLGIEGALLSAVISQFFMVLIFHKPHLFNFKIKFQSQNKVHKQ
jgi:O-antigen/teichoic acid export membrane protein